MISLFVYFSVFSIGTRLLLRASKRSNRMCIAGFLGLSLLIIFAAGRYQVGTDIVLYNRTFARLSESDWQSVLSKNNDLLFFIIAKVTYGIGGRVLTWGVFASLTAIPVYYALKNDYPEASFGIAYFTFLCSYYVTSFNVSRQMVAVSLVFWALKYVTRNAPVKFIILVLIATGFHTSALLAIPIWFLWDRKKGAPVIGYRRVLILLIAIVSVILYQTIILRVASNIDIFQKYDSYSSAKSGGMNRDFYVRLLELIIILLLRKKLVESDKRNDYLISLLFISVLINFTGFIHPQVKRIAYYYAMPARVILFGYLPYCFSGKNRAIVKMLLVLWIAGLFVLTAYILGEANLIPYRFDLFPSD